MDIIRFASDDLESVLVSHPERLEELPFGAILLDRAGVVRRYNKAQGVIWGRIATDMIGRPFFDEVAQCCRNTPVQFAFQKFLTTGFVDVFYEHEVPYRNRLIKVQIHIKAQVGADKCWIFSKLMGVSTLDPDADRQGQLEQEA